MQPGGQLNIDFDVSKYPENVADMERQILTLLLEHLFKLQDVHVRILKGPEDSMVRARMQAVATVNVPRR
jgi:hypothetical protein